MSDDGIYLRDAVLALGVPSDEVDRAEADGTLELVALERLVDTEVPTLDLDEVASLSGLGSDRIRAFWRSLGFPDPRGDERVFTETDIEMLGAVGSFIDEGSLDPDLALQMSRVIGSSMNRVAVALVEAVEAQLAADRESRMRAVSPLDAMPATEMLPLLPQIMELVWRRHLGAATRRRIVRATAEEGEIVSVGFADLVGFTAQTQELPEPQLAEVVGQFETIAYDLTSAHGGRVVKMIGDEVMFMTDSVRSGAELALDMAATYREAEHLSDVRVGLASGRVLERDGDIYGTVVNLASRIVNVAYPGAVVVSPDVRDALMDDDTFVFRSLRSHYLKDIGRVPLWALRAADDTSEQPFRHERRRRAARNTFTLSMTARPVFEQLGDALAPVVPVRLRRDDGSSGVDHDATTEQLAAISDAVLEADIDEDLQVELLADIEASRRLHELEVDAQRRSELVDLEAERRVAEAETEALRIVEEVEADARRRIEEVLQEAEEKSRKANDDANRKVAHFAETAERKAEAAKRDARRKAKRKTERKRRDRAKDDKHAEDADDAGDADDADAKGGGDDEGSRTD